jgi:hypothetical protein
MAKLFEVFAMNFTPVVDRTTGRQMLNKGKNATPLWSGETYSITDDLEVGNRKAFNIIVSRNEMPEARAYSVELVDGRFREVVAAEKPMNNAASAASAALEIAKASAIASNTTTPIVAAEPAVVVGP